MTVAVGDKLWMAGDNRSNPPTVTVIAVADKTVTLEDQHQHQWVQSLSLLEQMIDSDGWTVSYT